MRRANLCHSPQRASVLLCCIAMLCFPIAACGAVDAELVEALRSELDAVREEIEAAEERDAQLAGGLVKALVQARVEILKTTEALLQQRIHAEEAGARITTEIPGSDPDPEIAQQLADEIVGQQEQLAAARADAAQYSGGLVLAMKESAVATQEQTLAMLQQRYLAAQYGLPTPSPKNGSNEAAEAAVLDRAPESPPGVSEQVVTVKILSKQLREARYDEFVYFDMEYTASGLDKPSRAIKGVLQLQDLFGETKLAIRWTIDRPMQPEESWTEKGIGFEYNQFRDSHRWAATTDKENMQAVLKVESILYADDTRQNF